MPDTVFDGDFHAEVQGDDENGYYVFWSTLVVDLEHPIDYEVGVKALEKAAPVSDEVEVPYQKLADEIKGLRRA